MSEIKLLEKIGEIQYDLEEAIKDRDLLKRRWKELKKVIRNGPLTLDDYEIEAKMDDIEERIK